MERQIRQEQVIDAFVQSAKNGQYHVWPGAVSAFHASTWTADVQIMTNDPRRDPKTGQIYGEPWPVIPNVPVWSLRGAGFVVACPLKPNDPVLMLAWDIDPSAWLEQGPSTQAVNPHDSDRHAGGYWVAIPLNIFGPIQDAAAAASALLAGLDGDTAQVIFTSAQLVVGKAGCTVQLAGGGAAVGRVNDPITITPAQVLSAGLVANLTTGAVTASGNLQGTISGGSPKVTSG